MRSGKLIIICLALFGLVASIKFDIIPNVERCVKEEFRPDTLVKGEVEVSPVAGDMQLSLRVRMLKHIG